MKAVIEIRLEISLNPREILPIRKVIWTSIDGSKNYIHLK